MPILRFRRAKTADCQILRYGKEKITIHSKEELDTITKKLEGAKYQVAEVKKGERTKKLRFRLQPVRFSRKLPRC